MLIVLPCFQPHYPVLDHVRPAHAMLAADLIELLYQLQAVHLLSIQRDRHALFESNLNYLGGPVRAWGLRPAVDLLRRLEVGVLKLPSLDRAGPYVLIDRPGLLFGYRDIDAVLASIVYLPLASQVQLSHGSDNPAVCSPKYGLEAELVIAATGASVGQILYAQFIGNLCRFAGDERAGDGRSQNVSLI